MIVVGARFGNDVQYRARVAAILGEELVGDQANFLDDVRVVNGLLAARDAGVIDVLAINHEVVRTRAPAVCRKLDAL